MYYLSYICLILIFVKCIHNRGVRNKVLCGFTYKMKKRLLEDYDRKNCMENKQEKISFTMSDTQLPQRDDPKEYEIIRIIETKFENSSYTNGIRNSIFSLVLFLSEGFQKLFIFSSND